MKKNCLQTRSPFLSWRTSGLGKVREPGLRELGYESEESGEPWFANVCEVLREQSSRTFGELSGERTPLSKRLRSKGNKIYRNLKQVCLISQGAVSETHTHHRNEILIMS